MFWIRIVYPSDALVSIGQSTKHACCKFQHISKINKNI